MRSVPRRERHRRLRNAKDCACRYHSPTPQIFDRLELLDQQLNYALPVGIISQAINLASVREALLSAAKPRLSESFSRTDWLMIETLAQGASLKEIARQQSVPYHRVVYRLKQLITLLNLPHRQSFLRLIQQLNVTFNDIF
ncbi:hypothetical protein L1A23_001706 [Salmonella enterica]|nr:hypothetical protein [Salmonella enterica]